MNEQKGSIESSTTLAQPALLTAEMMKQPPLSSLKELPLNKVSNVIAVPNTTKFFIAMKLNKEAARTLTYNEVSSDIKTMLKAQSAQIALKKFYKELHDRAEIKVIDKSIFYQAKAAEVNTSADTSEKKQNKK